MTQIAYIWMNKKQTYLIVYARWVFSGGGKNNMLIRLAAIIRIKIKICPPAPRKPLKQI